MSVVSPFWLLGRWLHSTTHKLSQGGSCAVTAGKLQLEALERAQGIEAYIVDSKLLDADAGEWRHSH